MLWDTCILNINVFPFKIFHLYTPSYFIYTSAAGLFNLQDVHTFLGRRTPLLHMGLLPLLFLITCYRSACFMVSVGGSLSFYWLPVLQCHVLCTFVQYYEFCSSSPSLLVLFPCLSLSVPPPSLSLRYFNIFIAVVTFTVSHSFLSI